MDTFDISNKHAWFVVCIAVSSKELQNVLESIFVRFFCMIIT